MLEAVRGAVRRLYKISNCTFECDYYYYYYFIIIIIMIMIIIIIIIIVVVVVVVVVIIIINVGMGVYKALYGSFTLALRATAVGSCCNVCHCCGKSL